MVGYHTRNDFGLESSTNKLSQTCSDRSRTSSTLESLSTAVLVNLGVSRTPTSSTSRALFVPRTSWRRRACTAVSSESTSLVKRVAGPMATGLTVVADMNSVTATLFEE